MTYLEELNEDQLKAEEKSMCFIIENGVLLRYDRSYRPSVVIPEEVKEICPWVFDLTIGLRQVKILGKIKHLDYTVFNECFDLINVDLPASVEVICSKTFRRGTKISAPKDSYADIYGRYLIEGTSKIIDGQIISKLIKLAKANKTEFIHFYPAKARVKIDGITLETALIYTDNERLQVKGIINGEEIDVTEFVFLQKLKEVLAYEYYDGENLEKPFDGMPYVCRGLNLIISVACESDLCPQELLKDTVMQHRIFNLIAVAWGWGFENYEEEKKFIGT